ncbi:hypothetical protein HG530_013832 [Fusarium avenaceum]|nr:hypothetical protein HG530_013832 [Fusarium avenaceum]
MRQSDQHTHPPSTTFRHHSSVTNIRLVLRVDHSLLDEYFVPFSGAEKVGGFLDIGPVLPDDIHGRAREHNINLLEGHVLCLWHKKDLVDLSNHSNTTVESQSEAGLAHSLLHGGKIDKADKEPRKHGNSPESSAKSFHKENGRNGTDEEGSATNKGHVVGLLLVEANLVHEDGHVVHNRVHTSQLTKENHNVAVNESAAGAGLGEEVHPREAGVLGPLSDCVFFLNDGRTHNVELLAGVARLNTTDALPDLESVEVALLVDEETGTFREEEHAEEHDVGVHILESLASCALTRQKTSHGCKGNKKPGEVLRVGELDLEETLLETTRLLELALHIADKVIDLTASVAGYLESLELGLFAAHGLLNLILLPIDRSRRVLSTLHHGEVL